MFKRSFRLLASLKVAIPLLVLLTVVTIVVSLFPSPDLFRSWWYLALLGLQGLSLLFVTIQHIPSILKRKGRNALLGVISTHLGILVLIVGVIYGGYADFRHEIKLVEGQVTVVPGLPFAIKLDRLEVEEYRQEDFPRLNIAALPKKRQDSHITLLKRGKEWRSFVIAPGQPARADGFNLLPSVSDIGWYFEIITHDNRGREFAVPVRPWEPPMIVAGDLQIVVHSATSGDFDEVEMFSIQDDQLVSLGFASRDRALEVDGNRFTLGSVRRYTSMQVYDRPQEPVLILGCVLMFAGLVWHFYFRHRDRRREGQPDA